MLFRVQGGLAQDCAIAAPDGAPFLVLSFSEPAESSAEWDITIFAGLDVGRFVLGRFRTTSPAAGDPAARIIAQAYCAGAHSWAVTLRGPMGAEAQLGLSTGTHGAQAVGVVKVRH